MKDYRNKICIIDEKIVKKCIAQDYSSEKLYFPLDPDKQDLDCEYCNVPSYWLPEHRVRLLTEEESQNYILFGLPEHAETQEKNMHEYTKLFLEGSFIRMVLNYTGKENPLTNEVNVMLLSDLFEAKTGFVVNFNEERDEWFITKLAELNKEG